MFRIRGVRPDAADYAAIAAVRNAVWTDEPTEIAQLHHEDERWPPEHLFERLVVEVDGKIVAAGCYFENHWQYQPGKLNHLCWFLLRRRQANDCRTSGCIVPEHLAHRLIK